MSSPRLVRSFDPLLVPLTSYEIETPSPEENVAVALNGMAGALRRDGWSGRQRLQGSVKFGQIDYALLRQYQRSFLREPIEPEENPMIWAAALLIRGTVREQGGVTYVRIVFFPGYLPLLMVLGIIGLMTYLSFQLGPTWELVIAPAFAWIAMLGVHRASLRLVRAHAFAALGLPAH